MTTPLAARIHAIRFPGVPDQHDHARGVAAFIDGFRAAQRAASAKALGMSLDIQSMADAATAAIHRLTELGELDRAKALADALAKLEGK